MTALSAPAPRKANPEEYWSAHVQPVLDKRCLKCHAGVRQQGGLDLRSLETILRGGDSGPEIEPGKPEQSRLVQYISPASGPHMPPDRTRLVTPAEIAEIKTWVTLLPASASPHASAADNKWVLAYLAQYRIYIRSNEIPPTGMSTSATIDWFLQTDWIRWGIHPASLCDDRTFVRRIYLDLAGRIPQRSELQVFMADSRLDKRRKLIEKLLGSDEYAVRMREVFDVLLMGRPDEQRLRQRIDTGWYRYLENAFRTNRPWSDVVHDILVARPASPEDRGSVWFLAERNNNYQAIAEAVAPVVYGVQIKCAQCHNHPLAWEIEQKHYWGLVSAFNRSSNVQTDAGTQVAESAAGGFINFANLKKESQPALLVFLNGKSVTERIPGANEKEVDDAALYLVPPVAKGQKPHVAAVPRTSRREEFANTAIHDNPMLARAFVNRAWNLMMGRGLVQPADEIDSRHRASHPELLEWLSQDFERSGYNIKQLVESLALSRAYQLDTKPAGVPADSFARGIEKPLTGEQLYRSMIIACGMDPNAKLASEIDHAFTTAFPDVLPDNYSPSIQQALFVSNSPAVDNMLKPAAGNTVARIAAISSIDVRVKEAFLAVLSRSPDTIELDRCRKLLTPLSAEKGARILLWALIADSEFKVNH